MEPAEEDPAHLEVHGNTGTFVLLLYGRLSLHSTIAVGRFEAKGNLELFPNVDRWLEGHEPSPRQLGETKPYM